MHLITHGKARNTPVLIRKRALLDAVNLMQPLRHDFCQLIARDACGISPAKIEVSFLFQLIYRIIHPGRCCLRIRHARQRPCEHTQHEGCPVLMSAHEYTIPPQWHIEIHLT